MDRPETQFVWSGDSTLAYQVLGDGSPDLVYLPGWISNVELSWDHSAMARFLRGLARERRLIITDPRGRGCSERSTPRDVWPLETMMEDVRVLLDTAGSEQAAILATDELGFVACMFAATYPERTAALMLYRTAANFLWSEETPWEWTETQFDEQEEWLRTWFTRESLRDDLRMRDPTLAEDPAAVEWWYRYNVLSEALGSAVASARKYMYTDVRPILTSIHVPTLVLLRPDANAEEPSWTQSARFLAERIPGARLVELPGIDASPWAGDHASVLRAIDSFLADVRHESAVLERVLATVLFTDIVGSTEKLAELGNAGWRELTERHHAHVRALLERFRGTEVDTAGDGFLASFDGPARAIRCAQAIVDEVKLLGIEVRAGLHTGECELIDGKVGGMAVNIGARVGAAAQPSEVLVSQTVKDLVVGSGLAFADRGEHELKGVADRWRLYRVV
ncbi:MAG: adenylate/guanylate cyclase domain-containing protein [Gaiellaceae bacterium]